MNKSSRHFHLIALFGHSLTNQNSVHFNPHQEYKSSLSGRLKQVGGEPGLVDRMLALHAGSRGFDSQRGHMSERFFRSNRPGYPHPVSSELENSGIRVAIGDCSVTVASALSNRQNCACARKTLQTQRGRTHGIVSRESTSVVIVVWRNNRVLLGQTVRDFGPYWAY